MLRPAENGAAAAIDVPHPQRRVRVRGWRGDDAEALVAAANHPGVARYLRDRFPYPYTSADAAVFLGHVVPAAPGQLHAIEVDGAVAGGIGIHPGEDVERESAELGYWLTPRCWRQGIMPAVIDAYLPMVVASFGLRRVWSKVYAPNVASMRVLERCGFQREGVLRQAVVKRGEVLDALMYARLREPPA